MDGIERASLLAFAAANTGVAARLPRRRTFLLIDAAYIYTAVVTALVPQLDNAARTSLHTCSTCGTDALVHDRRTLLDIHGDGTELAGFDATAKT